MIAKRGTAPNQLGLGLNLSTKKTRKREFLDESASPRLPDETTIVRFRHMLEAHDLAARMLGTAHDLLQAKGLMLRTGTAVDTTLIAAPSSTKNQEGKRAPKMHQTKKGNQWHFGMKAHIGVDADWCIPSWGPRRTSTT